MEVRPNASCRNWLNGRYGTDPDLNEHRFQTKARRRGQPTLLSLRRKNEGKPTSIRKSSRKESETKEAGTCRRDYKDGSDKNSNLYDNNGDVQGVLLQPSAWVLFARSVFSLPFVSSSYCLVELFLIGGALLRENAGTPKTLMVQVFPSTFR
jgi:hypothetical protein